MLEFLLGSIVWMAVLVGFGIIVFLPGFFFWTVWTTRHDPEPPNRTFLYREVYPG